jgi:hypothetical protein
LGSAFGTYTIFILTSAGNAASGFRAKKEKRHGLFFFLGLTEVGQEFFEN